MGYMGLENWVDSDTASDFVFVLFKEMAKLCEKELKDPGNSCNTSGLVNVALFHEDFIHPIRKRIAATCNDKFLDMLNKTAEQMKQEIARIDTEEWDSEANKDWHLSAYRRMLKKLNETIKCFD